MRRALTLARRAWGRTAPNPMVGCVIVRNGEVVGEGYHKQAGLPHAEPTALAAAGDKSKDATLYVNLEPCSSQGRTPPCVEAIIRGGVRRVVIGCLDPFPGHEGRAVAALESRGIKTAAGLLKEAAENLNEAFLCRARRGRPFVLLKMAMTLDGKIATAAGESKWITGPKARRKVQRMRQWSDAIMVGGETVQQDNPDLRVRSPARWPRQPLKLIWSARHDFSDVLRIWQDRKHPPSFLKPKTPDEWREALEHLAQREISALLIEGGGELAAACLRAGIVDKAAFFIAPKILGGRHSRPVVAGPDPGSLADARNLNDMKTERVGEDLLVTGYLSDVHRSY